MCWYAVCLSFFLSLSFSLSLSPSLSRFFQFHSPHQTEYLKYWFYRKTDFRVLYYQIHTYMISLSNTKTNMNRKRTIPAVQKIFHTGVSPSLFFSNFDINSMISSSLGPVVGYLKKWTQKQRMIVAFDFFFRDKRGKNKAAWFKYARQPAESVES